MCTVLPIDCQGCFSYCEHLSTGYRVDSAWYGTPRSSRHVCSVLSLSTVCYCRSHFTATHSGRRDPGRSSVSFARPRPPRGSQRVGGGQLLATRQLHIPDSFSYAAVLRVKKKRECRIVPPPRRGRPLGARDSAALRESRVEACTTRVSAST